MPVIGSEPKVTPDLAVSHGLTREEYDRVVRLIGRDPTYSELGLFSALWSEHCSYKSSRVHLRRLPTKGPHVLQGPGENAGIVDVGGGLGPRLQDREPQPPVVHRAVPGRGDRGRRHPPRHLHDGRPAHRAPRLAPLRTGRRAGHAVPPRRGRRRDLPLRQLLRVPDGRGRGGLRAGVRAEPAGQRPVPGPGAEGRDLPGAGRRGGEHVPLRRRQDGPRRHPRRDHGVGGLRRDLGRAATDRPGRRPVHREAPPRGVSRGVPDRRGGGDPGHGRGRPGLLPLRDARAGGDRRRRGARPRAPARAGDDALRDPPVGVPGADAARRRARPRGRGPAGLPEVGAGRGPDRARHRRRRAPRAHAGRGGGRGAGPGPDRRGAGLRPAAGAPRLARPGARARPRGACRSRRTRAPCSSGSWRRRRSRRSGASGGSTITRSASTPSCCRAPTRPSSGSRERPVPSRWPPTATAATGSSIPSWAGRWRSPRPRATSCAPAGGRWR